MPNATILVVDDEQLIRWSLVERLRTDGYERRRSRRPAARRSSASPTASTSCSSTTSCPTSTASRCCARSRSTIPTSSSSCSPPTPRVDTAVEAMKIGAYHFANKPFNLDDIVGDGRAGARDDAAAARSAACCAPARRSPTRLDRIVGESPAMGELRDLLRKVAASPASTVLLTGESGTGKDLGGEGAALQQRPRQPAVREHHLLGASPRRCSRASCSATSAARSPTPASRSAACSSRPTAAPCSSTRSARWSPALQAKLLRFLEEKTFKRVGGSHGHPRRRARHRRHQPQPRRGGARPGTSARTCSTG